MSVMKLNAEEYLYLSKFLGTLNLKNDAFAEEVLLNENKLLFTDQKVINELEKEAGIEIFKEKNVLTKNDVMQQ